MALYVGLDSGGTKFMVAAESEADLSETVRPATLPGPPVGQKLLDEMLRQ